MQVQAARRRRGLSAQDVAELTAKVGFPISRNTIASLENGRKDQISIQEIMTIARALEIAPLYLIFPVGQVESVELPGGISAHPLWAAQWFTGEHEAAPESLHEVTGRYTWGEGKPTVRPNVEALTFMGNDSGPFYSVRSAEHHITQAATHINSAFEGIKHFRAAETAAHRDAWRSLILLHLKLAEELEQQAAELYDSVGIESIWNMSRAWRKDRIDEVMNEIDAAK